MGKPKKDSRIVRCTVDGTDYDIDLSKSKLPIRERIEFEEYLGMPFPSIVAGGWLGSEKGCVFIAFLAIRRKRKDATIAEVLDAKELTVNFEPEETKRPTKPTGESSGAQS